MDATQTTDPVFVMMRRRLLCVLLLCLSETQMDMALFAQSLVVSPSPQTPHWNHINVSDFGRALKYQGDASVRSTAYNWFGQHVDLAEVYGNAVDLRAPNPGMRLFIYQLDLSIFANEDSANLPEEYFLHFSENTEIRFRALNGSEVSTMTINGCPASEPVRRDCRVQSYLWTSRRYVYNLKSVAFQDWKATQLVQSTGRTINGVFLDEHGPGFIRPLSWGSQTVILSGGAIRELGGLRPGAARDALDQDYNTAMVAWLTYLQTRFHQAGKFIVLNPATYMLDPMVLDQIKALQGVSTEFMHRPDSWAGTYQYEEFIDVVKQVSSNGGTVDLAGTWCYTGPSGYTGGNYGSAQARYRMWRLASYYILKEPAGSSGIVYFDPSFCSNASVRPLEDASEWLLAYQVDVGQPVGQSVVYHEGSAGRSSSNAPCTFKVFGRT